MDRLRRWRLSTSQRFADVKSMRELAGHISQEFPSISKSSKTMTLDDKIALFQKEIKSLFNSRGDRIIYLKGLTAAFDARYRESGDADDLRQWISYAQDLLATTEIKGPVEDRQDALGYLTLAFLRRFEREGQQVDLNSCIAYGQRVTEGVSYHAPAYLHYYLSVALRRRAVEVPDGDSEHLLEAQRLDLEQAIRHAHQSLIDPQKEFDRTLYLANLSRCLFRRFQDFPGATNSTDLEDAWRYAEEAVDRTPSGHEHRVDHLDQLATCLMYRSLSLDLEESLDECIQLRFQIIDLVKGGSPQTPMLLHKLAVALKRRYNRTRNMSDINGSINFDEQAVRELAPNHRLRYQLLATLAASLGERYKELHHFNDIERAITVAQEAVDSVTSSGYKRSYCLCVLGTMRSLKFWGTGQDDELNRGVECLRAALSHVDKSHPEYTECCSYLGQALLVRSSASAQLLDLDEAIIYLEEGLKRPTTQHIGLYNDIMALCRARSNKLFLSRRSAERQLLFILANQQYQDALALLPKEHLEIGRYQCYLGLSELFLWRYKELGIPGDAQQALASCHNAMSSTKPSTLLTHAKCLHVLGKIYRARYDKARQRSDLDQSMMSYQQALESKDLDESTQVNCLFGIEGSRNRIDADFGSVGSTESNEETTQGNRQRSEHLTKLLDQSFREAKHPLVRLVSGMVAVERAALNDQWQRAATYLDEISPAVPEVIHHSRSREDQRSILRYLSTFVTLPATVYLKAGRAPCEALEVLECFNGIVANLQMDAKSDVSLLRERQPRLWSQYTECQEKIRKLEAATASQLNSNQSVEAPGTNALAYQRRQELSQELVRLRSDIRECAGFERFLLPLKGKEITDLANEGPLVCINIGHFGTHALLVKVTGVEVVSLPMLSLSIMRYAAKFLGHKAYPTRRDLEFVDSDDEEVHGPDDRPHDIDGIAIQALRNPQAQLQFWWYRIVKPILMELDVVQGSDSKERLPRIWWVGGGITSLIPLHMAGEYATSSMENTSRHVVSSYVPTLKILQSLRQQSLASVSSGPPKLLVVSMPTTPGISGALNTAYEANAIAECSASVADVTVLDRPNKESVLDALRSCDVVHFACHGSVDYEDPGKNSLIVGRDIAQHLTVNEVLDTVTRSGADVAYLSACSTAELQVDDHTHESIHLATAFQLAGFRSVVGTLWQAHDGSAVALAGLFYQLLFQAQEITSQSVAFALHEAVLQCRKDVGDEAESQFLDWAPFVHYGC